MNILKIAQKQLMAGVRVCVQVLTTDSSRTSTRRAVFFFVLHLYLAGYSPYPFKMDSSLLILRPSSNVSWKHICPNKMVGWLAQSAFVAKITQIHLNSSSRLVFISFTWLSDKVGSVSLPNRAAVVVLLDFTLLLDLFSDAIVVSCVLLDLRTFKSGAGGWKQTLGCRASPLWLLRETDAWHVRTVLLRGKNHMFLAEIPCSVQTWVPGHCRGACFRNPTPPQCIDPTDSLRRC